MKTLSAAFLGIVCLVMVVQAGQDTFRPSPYTGKPDNIGQFDKYSSGLNRVGRDFKNFTGLATYSSNGRMSKEDKRKVGYSPSTYLSITQLPFRMYQGAIVDADTAYFTKGTMFASTNDGVYKSTDNGNTWIPLKIWNTSYVRDTSDATRTKSYYCFTGHSSSSTNQPGSTGGYDYWEEVPDNVSYSNWSSSVSYSERKVSLVRLIWFNGYIWASPIGENMDAADAGLWRSQDGITWSRVQSLPVQSGVYNMAKLSNGDLFFSIYSLWTVNHPHIYRSTDNGATWSIVYTPPNTMVEYGGSVYISLNVSNTNHQPDISPTWWKLVPDTPIGTTGVSAWNSGTTYTVGRRHTHDIAASPDGSRIFCEIADPASGNLAPRAPGGGAYIPDGDPAIVMTTNGTVWSNWALSDSGTWPPNSNYLVGLYVIDNDTVLTTLESVYRESILKFTNGVVEEVYFNGLNNPRSPWTYSFYIKSNPASGNIFLPNRGGPGEIKITSDASTFNTVLSMGNLYQNINLNNISDFVDGKALIGWQQSGSQGYDSDGLYDTFIQYEPGMLIQESDRTEVIPRNLRAFSISDLNITFTDNDSGNADSQKHGYMPRLSGSAYESMLGDGTWGNPIPVQTYDNTNQRIGINTTDPLGRFHVAEETTSSVRSIIASQHNNGIQGGLMQFLKSRGTIESPSVINGGDILGAFVGYGYDGSAYRAGSNIYFISTGSPTGTLTPAAVQVHTNDGATVHTPAEFNSDGSTDFNGAITVDGVIDASAAGVMFADGLQTNKAVTVSSSGTTNLIQYSNGSGGFSSNSNIYKSTVGGTEHGIRADNLYAGTPGAGGKDLITAYDTAATVNTRIPAPGAAGYVPFGVAGTPTTYSTEAELAYDSAANKLTVGAAGAAESLRVEGTSVIQRTSTSTNAFNASLTTTHKTSADMVDGFGTGLTFRATDSGATDQLLGQIGAARDGADNSGAIVLRPSVTGTATEKMRVASSGLITMSNGGGVPFGHQYSNTSTTIGTGTAGANVWVEMTTNMTAGALKNVTHGGSHYLVATTAGYYKIETCAAVGTAAAGDEVALSVMVNGTSSATSHGHATVVNATTTSSICSTTILSLAANDQISVGFENHSAARDITVSHAQQSMVYIGSP